jgi:hypothetical protein
MDSEEIRKHFRQQTRTKKHPIPDKESRQEISKAKSEIEEFAKHEDFGNFLRLLERLDVKADMQRVAIAQFSQMVSKYKKQ